MLMQARYVGRHGGTSVSYPGALAQATNDRIAKEKGAALWHWVTADPYGNFIIKDIRVAECNHISTQSQVISCMLSTGQVESTWPKKVRQKDLH